MRKKLSLIIIFLLAAVVIVMVLLSASVNRKTIDGKISRVCFGSRCFEVELAKAPEEIKTGLMFRKSLDKNKGMLFVFDKAAGHSFWMKNTLIPLDIVWLDKNGQIVFISENNQPCRESSCSPISSGVKAKYVLETNAGTAKESGFKIGDKTVFK